MLLSSYWIPTINWLAPRHGQHRGSLQFQSPLPMISSVEGSIRLANSREADGDMENAVQATEILANLGIFLAAVGVLWGVTVYRDKQ